jgi:hypothetical protein
MSLTYDPVISRRKGTETAVDVAVGGTPVVGILLALRALGILPWPVEADAALATVLTGAWTAARRWWRNRKKHTTPSPETINAARMFAWLILPLFALAGLVGCNTMLPMRISTLPDGTVIQEVDVQASIQMMEQTLAAAERAYELWQEHEAEEYARDAEEAAAEEARLQSRIDLVRMLLSQLMAQAHQAD